MQAPCARDVATFKRFKAVKGIPSLAEPPQDGTSIRLRGVEQGHASLDRGSDDANTFLSIDSRTVTAGEAHRAVVA